MAKPVGPYTPIVRAGEWLIASGQVGLGADGLVDGGMAAELRQAFANLRALLESEAAGLDDVVKTTVFLVDMADYVEMNEIYVAEFGDHRPARSAVAVAELPIGARVEIEAWAQRGRLMDFELSAELKALRSRARAVAADGVARFGRYNDSWINGFSKDFARVMAEEGWIGMGWPAEHGGRDRPPIERVIVAEEMIAAGAPIAAMWFADRQMGPTLIAYGTPDQQSEYLPAMLAGETTWCIGMSEPDAGSDLAALSTSATRDGDDWVINGQKVWTSFGDVADYCYLICRTGRDGPPHRGISEIIVPMTTPGIEVRTITDMTANRHFCEVYFTDVRVPAHYLVGVEGDAFKQTMRQLEHERGGIDRLVSNRALYDRAVELADRSDPVVRQEIARLESDYRVGRMLVYREVLRQAPAGFSSATKCFCTEHQQRVADFAGRILGPHAGLDSEWSRQLAYAPGYTIMGGTSNVMRNILGERVLGLPREPRV